MRNISHIRIIILSYIFFLTTGSIFGVGERSISIGGEDGWGRIERRQDIVEASMIRPNPVLVLSGRASTSANIDANLDAYLSFDEGTTGLFRDSQGNYDISIAPQITAVGLPWSMVGPGAALFTGGGSTVGSTDGLTLKPLEQAIFAQGNNVRDFSIEFWLYPHNLETGEQIFFWNSVRLNGRGTFDPQRIQANVSRNRLVWTFDHFFLSPGRERSQDISFSSPLLLNRTWSHHLIRFDADLGLLEYLVDGRLEVVEYMTSNGREGGEVFTPHIGRDPRIVLGGRFTGMIDEFRIHRLSSDSSRLTRYPSRGGRIQTHTIDLGRTNSRVNRVEAFGGRTGIPASSNFNQNVRNEYAGNGQLRFPDHSEISLFIRTSNHRYIWDDSWTPIISGAPLPPGLEGRYVQIAADFFPCGRGETSPYLSEIKVFFHTAEPPTPPSNIIAVARDGAVELSWRPNHSRNLGGYILYYGTASGEYFGDNGMQPSPIDVGNRTSIRIEGLRNGTLYYFAVAAYDMVTDPAMHPEPGDFSREVAARPLRMAE
ncbi:MAG: hypothetical protein FWG77_04845 [Treponema sp.]|nr:hypothetical protein [Treponema sp.]